MRRVLIVSPHFPPFNAADMQRVRMSLPHFREWGWEPSVLAVAPGAADRLEPLLCETLPADVAVERTRSLPSGLTRVAGIGNIALRALPFLYAQGRRLIRQQRIDLVYFSTTMFLSMPLGRLWKRASGTPFVLDIQDPWFSDYYASHPSATRPPKFALAQRLHGALEPWTMAAVDGLVAVSGVYLETLRRRYGRLEHVPSAVLPFGASTDDFAVLDRTPQPNRHFTPGDGYVHGVYAGRGGPDMATGLSILFGALRANIDGGHEPFGRTRLHFVGTDYAADARARPTVMPVAERAGVSDRVAEDTTRAPYFEALQLLRDADFLLVVGSDDPSYTASKIFPYVLARRPLLAVLHERSPLVPLLREWKAGVVVTFPSAPDPGRIDAAVRELAAEWRALLTDTEAPRTDWSRFQPFTAREMTRRQCALFDAVLAAGN